jgi:diaminopimelate epimerase
MRFEQLSGAGNHFLLLDARQGVEGLGLESEDASWLTASIAREWCAAAGEEGEMEPDGLLVLLGSEVAAARLVIWNSDGSLAAACGNGLRCAGWYLLRESGSEEVVIETQTGTRKVSGESSELGAERLKAELGPVRVEPLEGALTLLEGERAAWRGDVGNPHCVFLVEKLRSPRFEERGRALQTDPLFPGGVNVGYLAEEAGRWRLRVFERGAGETGACGTGAAAAAAVLREAFGLAFPLCLQLPEGELTVTGLADGGLSVTGGVEFRGPTHLALQGLDLGS